jgi:hypothetical protein
VQPTLIYQQLSTVLAADPPRVDRTAVPPRLRPALARALKGLAARVEPDVPAPAAPAAKPVPRRPVRGAGARAARRPACAPARVMRIAGRPRRGGPP